MNQSLLVEPLLAQRYDFIVATYSLHHLTDEQKVSILRVLQDHLNPGGQILIEDGDKILLQNRVKKDWQGYALPGGHVEPGESFVDAVIREMKEETGLTILDPRLVGVKQFPLENGRYVVLLFKATQWSGNLISSEEGQMEWIKYSDLSKVKTVDDFDDLLKVMNTPELTEFQYLVSGDEWTVSIR